MFDFILFDVSQLELSLYRGADKDAKDVDYYTPLLTAAEFGRVQCFNLLLRHGASIEVKNKDRRNAVFLAAESNHPLIIEVWGWGREGKWIE